MKIMFLLCPLARLVTLICFMVLIGSSGQGAIPFGDRHLAIDVNLGQAEDYGRAVTLARNAGMQEIKLFYNWNMLENGPEQYNDNLIALIDQFYPAWGLPVHLTLAPIHTNQSVVPSDLAGLALDNPQVIGRYKALLDYVFSHLTNVQIMSLNIGSEMDVFLGTNETLWLEFHNFYQQTSAYARTLRPGIMIGCEATMGGLLGLTKERMLQLNQLSDMIAVSYYPLNTGYIVQDPSIVAQEFGNLAALYTKPIFFLQLGYPSSAVSGSNEQLQSTFVTEIFRAWDAHASSIKLINFTWLHDLSVEEAQTVAGYYGINEPTFKEYLRTLGLRSWEGFEKIAFLTLQREAGARGWPIKTKAAEAWKFYE
jgi:hypothetical protein